MWQLLVASALVVNIVSKLLWYLTPVEFQIVLYYHVLSSLLLFNITHNNTIWFVWSLPYKFKPQNHNRRDQVNTRQNRNWSHHISLVHDQTLQYLWPEFVLLYYKYTFWYRNHLWRTNTTLRHHLWSNYKTREILAYNVDKYEFRNYLWMNLFAWQIKVSQAGTPRHDNCVRLPVCWKPMNN